MKTKYKLLFILLLALILRLVIINQSFWLDEAAQVIESARPLGQQLNLAADFHPPFYHILLHFWMKFGHSELWIRLLTVLFSLGSIYGTYILGKVIFSQKAGLLAAFFLSISSYHVWYSQEARPYMLFVFLSVFSTLFLIRKKWLLFCLTTILSFYALYFAPIVAVGQGIYIFLTQKKDINSFIKYLSISLLFFVPWLPYFINQLTIGTNGFFTGWKDIVSVSPIRIIPLTFAKFIISKSSIANNYLYGFAILPVLLIFILSVRKIYYGKKGRSLLILFFSPFLLTILISLIIPIAAPQRLIFLLPLFFLIIAGGIEFIRKPMSYFLIIIVLVTSLLSLYNYYVNPHVQREKWREATEFVEQGGKDSIALFIFPEPFAPFKWYEKGLINAKGIAPGFRVTDEDLNNLGITFSNKKKVFLFQYLTDLTDSQHKTRNYLIQKGFSENTIKDFPGVGFIYIYDKK